MLFRNSRKFSRVSRGLDDSESSIAEGSPSAKLIFFTFSFDLWLLDDNRDRSYEGVGCRLQGSTGVFTHEWKNDVPLCSVMIHCFVQNTIYTTNEYNNEVKIIHNKREQNVFFLTVKICYCNVCNIYKFTHDEF